MMVKDIASWTPCLVGTKGDGAVTATVVSVRNVVPTLTSNER
jgi:hypothetical protein